MLQASLERALGLDHSRCVEDVRARCALQVVVTFHHRSLRGTEFSCVCRGVGVNLGLELCESLLKLGLAFESFADVDVPVSWLIQYVLEVLLQSTLCFWSASLRDLWEQVSKGSCVT